ncbi:MAG: MerR family transcriptional regulator, partial [Leptospiraceae bacterium]|nr:MerR family transcriptional regulator [Leptospiraceae bacterium]
MKYLIKDLSKMTGIKGFTIRKWQERYKIFRPQLAPNGYWYYTNEDYEVLAKIVRFLEEGEKISHIVALGRENLLKFKNEDAYTDEEKQFLRWIEEDNFSEIENLFESQANNTNFPNFIRHFVERKVSLVGRAWQDGLISIAD